ncbi:peroxiredoxin-2E-1, chloroplastic-like [Carex rostrata]
MAAATATAASFSVAARRLLCPTSFPSATIRFRQFRTAARPNLLISTQTPHQRLPLQRSYATASPATSTTISVGDKLPEAALSYFDSDDELKTVTISELTKGKKAILFAVPGAFTPTCSQKHVPGFVEKAKELKAKGVDVIACVSVNDAFVMKAWKEDLKVGDEVVLLSDGNGVFTKALGVELDLSDKPVGLGVRSRRYALLAEDGVVKILNLEEGGAFTTSGAEDMLKAL